MTASLGLLLFCPFVHATSSVNVGLQASFSAAPFLVELL